jgi:ATP-dependent metalloprotease
MAPWRGVVTLPKNPVKHNHASRSTRLDGVSEDTITTPAQRVEASPNATTLDYPDFLREVHLSSIVAQNVTPCSPINIHSTIASMPRHALAIANPLVCRPFQPLVSRPLAAFPGLRSLHTIQRSAMRSLVSSPRRQMSPQYRGFGTGGISRSLLASREAAANRNPNSATAQNAFYQVLLKANMPAIVVERYQTGMQGGSQHF